MPAGSQSPHCTRISLVLVSMVIRSPHSSQRLDADAERSSLKLGLGEFLYSFSEFLRQAGEFSPLEFESHVLRCHGRDRARLQFISPAFQTCSILPSGQPQLVQREGAGVNATDKQRSPILRNRYLLEFLVR